MRPSGYGPRRHNKRRENLVPTVEEYTTLLRCPRIQADGAYSRAANVSTFLNRLMSITGMSEQ
ncbi:6-phosphofructo-2-kinase/fructose-2,6-bisphosphatase-like protein [Gossypium australe]|uniref:6-phosphofructo-2-kinase/fructose-2, 6-bisphosphatase-like protein n=1 Tax=Gossypium australe TaxID=47621 RepID=A0A5B6VD93_9ROSI|nr:6-phosphofructo-2-kinase/fructose-2,6-bisphosphatase-like protein [Gossypium australe]